MRRALLLTALLLASTAPVSAQRSKPQPTPIVDTIPAARDVPYPGTIKLVVDATDVRRAIWRVKETIPAKAGKLTLLFPEWLPGKHGPRGEIEKLAGLKITANGKPVPWKRDPVDVYAFHIDVPQGASEVVAEFQFLSATQPNQGRVVATPEMLNLEFEQVSLYPAGYFTRQIPIQATVTYPAGWTAASALRGTVSGSTYRYQPVDYEVLQDSPVFAGRYFRKFEITPRVTFNVVADNQAELDAAKPEHIEPIKRLVDQAVKLYGTQHYDHYDFLAHISDTLGGIGLEHHRSTEISIGLGFFKNFDENGTRRNVIAHEYVHSWNGKFRRPADLWTPDFRMPMRNSLLWVYEGQTQFWGYMLQARSGLASKQDTLDQIAGIAANLDNRPAREWRPLIDTTNDPIISDRQPQSWTSWQRSEDYYNEGLLVWLEVNAIIRDKTGGKKSIDDFARAFFGINDGDYGEATYTFEDVVKTLNGVVPYDWAGFLTQRLTETGKPAPLNGLTGNGYKLIYTEEPTDAIKKSEKDRGGTDLSYSLGFALSKTNTLSQVRWGGPAFDAGLRVGDELVAVNGTPITVDALKAAVTAAKTSKEPIKLLFKLDDSYREIAIDYHGGLRYPRLEKIGSGETGLDRLLAPLP